MKIDYVKNVTRLINERYLVVLISKRLEKSNVSFRLY